MPTTRPIDPINIGSAHLDKDLVQNLADYQQEFETRSNEINDDISAIRPEGVSDNNNQFAPNRSSGGAFKFFWGGAAQAVRPAYVILDNGIVVQLSGGWIDEIGMGFVQWEIPDAKVAAIDALGSVQFNQMLPLGLADADHIEVRDRTVTYAVTADTGRLTPQAHMQNLTNAIYQVVFEDNPQTSIQDETEEIKGWYADKVNHILEAKHILYKQVRENIDFVVVVDHIRRDHSFQLSDTACELDDLYPDWEFGFQYISTRTAGQLPLDEYSDITNGG